MLHSIDVSIAHRKQYAITVGLDVWDDFLTYAQNHYSPRKLFMVIDEHVQQLHGDLLEQQCSRYFESIKVHTIPEGEKSKSFKVWSHLVDDLLQQHIERNTPLLAVGGGVTGDVAGFAAASALRGVPLVHLPTSLLAMVDSSIGGKTGINHSSGKNRIGAFYQPDAVFMPGKILETLAPREWAGGMAEMLKYAAIRDASLFEDLHEVTNAGLAPSKQWMSLIHRCAAIKVDIVQADVHEAGTRAVLNFGHTFGHALEKWAGYGAITHGEAVYIGMMAGIHYSNALGARIDDAPLRRFASLYDLALPDKDIIPDLIAAMRTDKKVQDNTLRLILLEAWGKPYIQTGANKALLREAWSHALNPQSYQS